MQVGRVEEDVRERGVPQGAGPERADGGVEAGTDPGHLGLGHAGPAERGDQVIDAAGGDAVDVGLHHHRVQGLVDPPAGLEDLGEERALAQLRDRQVHVPGLRGEHPCPGAVALGDAGVGPLVPGGADHLRGLELDQVLQRDPDRFTDQVHALPGAEHLEQLGQGRLGQGHR